MLCPIKVLDFELADEHGSCVAVPSRYRLARLLVRWHGRPIGRLDLPPIDGRLRRSDVLAAAISRLAPSLAAEAARRGLHRGLAQPLSFDLRLPPPAPPAHLPTLSVALCTRDRPDQLAVALQSLTRLDPPPLEIIVVDNAPSTSATADLLRTQYPQFTYVREDRPGLDHARNRAIEVARGEIMAFTDDDVAVDPHWVGALAETFAADPDIGLVTGLIEPAELETPAQLWFERYGGFGRGYRRTYLQASPGRPLTWSLIGAGQLGAGANMAVRRELFERIGRFDPALDVGTPTLGGGDHEMFYRLIKSGCLCVYEPGALVRHFHRRTMPQLEKLLYDYGHATRCLFERIVGNFPEDGPGVRRLTRWWWRHWAWQRWRQAWLRPQSFPRNLVWSEIRGFWNGRGRYVTARRRIVSDEAQRPDAFRQTERLASPQHPHLQVALDLARPVRDVPEAANAAVVQVLLRLGGRSLGSVHVPTHGKPLSAQRLIDLIVRQHWARLLAPTGGSESAVLGLIQTRLADAASTEPSSELELPNEFSASIIVATCDRPDDLRRCLSSLQRLNTTRRLQIIVVDNRPASKLTPAVVREFADVRYVPEPRPGSSYARNAGVAAATGDFIVMTDDDMEVDQHWLERLLQPFRQADIMAVTGITLPARVQTDAERWFEAYGGFSRGYVTRDFTPAWFWSYRRCAVPTWQIGGTGNVAFRAEAFSHPDIGPCDERLGSGVPTGVGEDTKLFYDILQAGFTIRYEPSAVAWHHHRVTLPALRKQLFGYSKGHVAYHLITLQENGDKRALVRLFYELPRAFASRAYQRLRGRYAYPWRLLLVEIAGTLAGPWSLWQANQHVRRHGSGARRLGIDQEPSLPGSAVARPESPAAALR